MFWRKRNQNDFNAEIDAHVELEAARLKEQGLSEEDARAAARRAFGNVTRAQERFYESGRWLWWDHLRQDVRFGLRMLRRNPGFTAVAVLTLALGIGANTAIFSVVNAVVLRPLPYPHSERLVWIAETDPFLKAEVASGADYFDWRDQNQVLEGLAAYDPTASFNLSGRGTPARVRAAGASASFFATLGVSPQLGRGFTEEEDRPNGPHAVILMHAFWQQYFGSDPNVLGRTVTLNATPYTVVGVMPASFRFPGQSDVQMRVPLALDEAKERQRQMMRIVTIIGRLKPHVTLTRARSDLDAIRTRAQAAVEAAGPGPGMGPAPAPGPAPAGGGGMMRFTAPGNVPFGPGAAPPPSPQQGRTLGGPRAPEQFNQPIPGPGTPRPGGRLSGLVFELKVIPLEAHLAGNLRPAILTLFGVVGLVLLIACANVANLMLTRASARTREVTVRAVLGAGRGRLMIQLLTESLLVALAGGLTGLLLAAWGQRLVTRLIPASVGGPILGVVSVRLDAHVLLFTLAVAVGTGLVFGLAPALAATRLDLAEGLKEGAQAAGTGRRGLLRGALAVAELSLALMLLIGAGLLIKSFYRVLSIDPGFRPEHVLTMDLNLTDARYPSPQQRAGFFSEVLRRVESLPGVRSAALADSLPLHPYQVHLMIPRFVAGSAGAGPNTTVMFSRLTVSPAYFYTLGIPVRQGRTFTDRDNEQSPKVAVVNEALASHMWPGENPVGKQLPLFNELLTVVGVVGNARHEGLSSDVESEIYVPYLQQPGNSMQLAVRTDIDPVSLTPAVRAQIAGLDPEQPIYNVTTLEHTLSESVAPRRFNMLLLGIFAGIALALATVGIYGVMAFSVTQRTHEVGIRMALGAAQRDVLGLILRQGLRLTLVGVALGATGAWGLTRFLSSFLFGVRPTDPATFVLVSLALVTVAILASYIPARRATKVDPIVALRYE